jgi:hypothetical protein
MIKWCCEVKHFAVTFHYGDLANYPVGVDQSALFQIVSLLKEVDTFRGKTFFQDSMYD